MKDKKNGICPICGSETVKKLFEMADALEARLERLEGRIKDEV